MHAQRCFIDTACLAGVGMTVLGWLPTAIATLASLAAAVHYGLLVYDRFKGKPPHA